MSCLGVMFAPHHQASADELVRVCRPGGTIGLLSWTPEGFIGQMFAAMKPYAPPPPPGAQPPPLWGSEHHVRGLLGDRVTGISARRGAVRVDLFPSPQTSATTSRPATARPSPSTRASPMIPAAPRNSTRHSPTSPAAMTTEPGPPSWTGNTCSSPAGSRRPAGKTAHGLGTGGCCRSHPLICGSVSEYPVCCRGSAPGPQPAASDAGRGGAAEP